MRTTIAVDDVILERAKSRAQGDGLTLGQLIERALTIELGRRDTFESPPIPTYAGTGGLVSGVDPDSNRSLRTAVDSDTPPDLRRW